MTVVYESNVILSVDWHLFIIVYITANIFSIV